MKAHEAQRQRNCFQKLEFIFLKPKQKITCNTSGLQSY